MTTCLAALALAFAVAPPPIPRAADHQLELAVQRVRQDGKLVRITHTLRWSGQGTRRLAALATFHYHFMDRGGRLLGEQRRAFALGERFLSGGAPVWGTEVVLEAPAGAAAVLVDYPSQRLVPRPITLPDQLPASPSRYRGGLRLPATLSHTEDCWCLAFSPDGMTLATGGLGDDWRVFGFGVVNLWCLAAGCRSASLKAKTSSVFCVAFSTDGKTLAAGTLEGETRLWHGPEWRPGAELSPRWRAGCAHGLAFSPDGEHLATGCGWRVDLWALARPRQKRTWKGHTLALAPLPFSLLAGDAESLAVVCEGSVAGVAYSPDGRSLATADSSGAVRLWSSVTAREKRFLGAHEKGARAVAFSPDGKTLASCGDDGLIYLWDVASGARAATLRGHAGLVWSVAFSPDGKALASGGEDKTIRLWDIALAEETAALRGHTSDVVCVAFSPCGQALASAGGRFIKLWPVPR